MPGVLRHACYEDAIPKVIPMTMQDSPGYQPPYQGAASLGDVTTALQGIIRQITAGNTQLASILAALNGTSLNGYTVATLPSSPSIGNMAYVSDGGAALAWGATVTGGASTFYIVGWNGANWTVVGK